MAVVVSAMGGKPKVTDLLLKSVSLAAAGNRAGSEVRFPTLRPHYLGYKLRSCVKTCGGQKRRNVDDRRRDVTDICHPQEQ